MDRFGLALGSGGARGLAHVGVLSVLEKEGLTPAFIAGTSMGAIIGALYAEECDIELVAEKLWAYVDDPDFRSCWDPFIEDEELRERASFLREFHRALQKKILTFKTFSTQSQQSADALLDPLIRLLGEPNIEDLKIPFAAVAVDLLSGQASIFRNGGLVPAIYASSAIPGVFPPMPYKNQLLIDGGGPYRVPVNICRELGAELVVAVEIPSFSPVEDIFKTGMDVMMRSDAIARLRLNRIILKEADLVVEPDVGQFHWANFKAADQIREAGEEAMRTALPELKRLLAERRSLGYRFRRSVRRVFGGDRADSPGAGCT